MHADLHMHSTASDGQLSPSELMKQAAACEIDLISLTDHDTVAGQAEAEVAAAGHNIKYLPGVELTAEFEERVVHIVGLNINYKFEPLLQWLDMQQQRRADRAKQIALKLEKLGIENALQQAETYAQGVPGRPHFAKVIVDAGLAPDTKRVFKKYLVNGKPGFVKQQWPSVQAAIEIIHQSGGLAVFAHPTRYNLSATKIRKSLAHFKEMNGDGVEVISGNMNANDLSHTVSLANRYDLLASQGSDFHGAEMPWLSLGVRQKLPETLKPIWQELL